MTCEMIIFMQDARKNPVIVFVLAYHSLSVQTEHSAKDASPTCIQQISETIWKANENFANQEESGLFKTGKYGEITFKEHGQFRLK